MLTWLLRFLIFILNWSIFAMITWLNIVLLSDEPSLTLFNYTFNQRQLYFFNALLMMFFTYKERHRIKNGVEHFFRWIKTL
ncbi:hypothetical protein [Gallibacterium sp. ZY190522]